MSNSFGKGRELLVEGMRSYPLAVLAMDEFCRLLEAEIREALKRSRTEIQDSIKFKLPLDAVRSYRRPERMAADFVRNRVAVGVSMPVGIAGCKRHTIDLEWNQDTDTGEFLPSVVASLLFAERETAKRIEVALKQASPDGNFGETHKKAFLLRELQSDDIEKLPHLIDAMIKEWCAAWRKTGGLQKLLQP